VAEEFLGYIPHRALQRISAPALAAADHFGPFAAAADSAVTAFRRTFWNPIALRENPYHPAWSDPGHPAWRGEKLP
jgi:hypothetical protein